MIEKYVRAGRIGGLVLMCALAVSTVASAQTLTPLVNFNGSNGQNPNADLIADAAGNLFGTTYYGGASGVGTVFEIARTSTGYATTPATLVSFNAVTGGEYPNAGLIADAGGNLFGTTASGGTYGEGTVFELAKTSSGYATTPAILVSFNDTDGNDPNASLIADAGGNLFGTTVYGGAYEDGTVFKVAKTSSGYATAPITLVNFDGTNGANPYAGLLADAGGNLFSTTSSGGASGDGTVFEIVKDPNAPNGYDPPATLVSFDASNGSFPYAGLIADAGGNLFGTTYVGGPSNNGEPAAGTVFEVTRTSSGYATTPTTLAAFYDTNGALPAARLIADASGNLFGTTQYGGASGNGTVFEVAKSSTGYAGTPTTLVNFNGADGANPLAGLIADASGNLFGTAYRGGTSGDGEVFELSGTGFLPPRHFVGTPGTPSCQANSISSLAQTYGGLAHAASSVGYSSVQALQNAIAHYCSH